eukprot:5061579-Heterocapsa_arctica.AAC.1
MLHTKGHSRIGEMDLQGMYKVRLGEYNGNSHYMEEQSECASGDKKCFKELWKTGELVGNFGLRHKKQLTSKEHIRRKWRFAQNFEYEHTIGA